MPVRRQSSVVLNSRERWKMHARVSENFPKKGAFQGHLLIFCHIVDDAITARTRGSEARAAPLRQITAAVDGNFFAPKQRTRASTAARSKAARSSAARSTAVCARRRCARRRCCSARRRCARRRCARRRHAQRRRTLNGGTLEPRRRHCCRRKEFFSCFTELLQITVVTRRRRDHVTAA